MAEVLKGTVGLAVKGKPKPRNDPADVELLRRMLFANGYKVQQGGPAGPDLYREIIKAAGDNGIEMESALVEPNSPLTKALKARYERAKKDGDAGGGGGGEGSGKGIRMLVVECNGKTLKMLGEDYKRAVDVVCKSLERYINQLARAQTQNRKVLVDYNYAWSSRKSFLESVAQVTTVKAGRIKPIDEALANAAHAAVLAASSAVYGRKIAGLDTKMKEAEKQVSASSRDVDRFLKEFTGSAGNVATVLTATSAVGFAIVGAMAAPIIAPQLGISVAAAGVLSQGSVAVVSSLSTDLGKVTANAADKVTFYQALNNATIDGLVAAATAGIGNKLPLGFVGKISEKIAPKIAAKVGGVSAQQLTPVITRFLTGAGEEGCKSAVGEVMTYLGKKVKAGGMALSSDDFNEAVTKIVLSTVTGGLVKKLGEVNDGAVKELQEGMEGTIVTSIRDVLKGKSNAALTPKIEKAVSDAIAQKYAEEVTKIGLNATYSQIKGSESVGELVKWVKANALTHPKTKKMLEKAILEELKKRKLV